MHDLEDAHQSTTFGGRILGARGAIASEHYLSAQAGLDLLKAGGNAFDAAAAAALVEAVVNPHMFTLGGECPILLYVAAENRAVAVNGNTMAPARATLKAYRDRGLDLIPPAGVLAAGVPAAVSALLEVLKRYGSMPLENIIEPAQTLAREGFPLHDGLVHQPGFGLEDNRRRFAREWPGSASIYLREDSPGPRVGEILVNAPLAGLLEALKGAARGKGERVAGLNAALDLFYRGEPAQAMAAFVQEREGLLEFSDFASFRTRFEDPIRADFRDHTVCKCGPWSQGPVFLQLLRLLDGFDLAPLGHNSPDYLHLWVEAAKLAYADREQYYGDPEQVSVPLEELLSEKYSELRRQLIDGQRADFKLRPGDPWRPGALLPEAEVRKARDWGHGTVHVAVADRHGNMAALTPSGGWISGNEVIPSLGLALGTRMQTFYLMEGHPNVVAPGKRPRTTLSPSLAWQRGRPWMAFGTMGGDQQDQWTSQFFLNRAVFGMSLQAAIEAPKITFDHIPGTFYPHAAAPGQVRLEGRVARETAAELSRRGHRVLWTPDWSAGYICAVARNANGVLEAGADPRGNKAPAFPSAALAW
ncbi:MAG: gamma-glutamyltransferase family protein [Desulfobaccales bacterium]